MGVLDGVVIIEGEVLGVNLEHAIVTNGDCCDALFPNYFEEDLLNLDWTVVATVFSTAVLVL